MNEEGPEGATLYRRHLLVKLESMTDAFGLHLDVLDLRYLVGQHVIA